MTASGEEVREVVALAGGKIVGKTRLQKAVYILELANIGFGFDFSYHHFGPYSEELTWAAREATIDGIVQEHEEQARWGGTYSIFSAPREVASSEMDQMRAGLLGPIYIQDSPR